MTAECRSDVVHGSRPEALHNLEVVVGKVAAGVGGDGQGVVDGLRVKRPLGSRRARLPDSLGKETLQQKSNMNRAAN